jgi:hypothetical protein
MGEDSEGRSNRSGLRCFCSLATVHCPLLLPLNIELLRMQRGVALNQDVLAGKLFEFG